MITVKISVIIPNWDGKDLLEECLPSVIDAAKFSKERCEIIVVDDGSMDDSVRFLKSRFPSVKIVSLKENGGYVKAINAGVKAASGDLVALVNNDVQLKKDFFARMLKHFKKKDVFGVSAKLLRWDRKTVQSEFLGCNFVLGTVVQTQPGVDEPDTNRFKEPCLTYYALGCASLIDRKKFLEIGGFDEIYSPFYGEEADLSFRAYKRGYVVIYEPKAVAYHKHMATIASRFKKNNRLLQELKNRYIFTWSNFYDPVILAKHFLFLPLVFVRSGFKSKYRSGRFLDVMAFFLALRNIQKIMRKRAEESRHFKLSDREALALINSNQANEIAPVGFRTFLKKEGVQESEAPRKEAK